jgi:peptidoglycan/LPS O-acetylase OafA/YrhL
MSVAATEITSESALTEIERLRHIPELDGVRGIAILLVLICHFGYLFPPPIGNWLSLGWVGVDLFFVLSGFLITRILVAARGQEGYFRNFYLRRAIRIFPLYFLFVGIYFFALLPAAHRHGLLLGRHGSDQLWYWTYLGNWHIGSEHSTLTHLWSLGIEEQFYLVWPLVIWLVPRRWIAGLCGALVAISLVTRVAVVWHYGLGREASFFTVCRMEGIALGALLAAGFRIRGPRRLLVLAVTVLPILLAMSGPNGFGMTVFGVTAIAVLFAVVLQAVIEESSDGTLRSRILRNGILTSLGKYSYSIYLFHILLLTAAVRLHESRGWSATLLFAGGLSGSYLMGWVSWQLFESRMLMLKRHFSASAKKVRIDRRVPRTGEKTSKVAEVCILQ